MQLNNDVPREHVHYISAGLKQQRHYTGKARNYSPSAHTKSKKPHLSRHSQLEPVAAQKFIPKATARLPHYDNCPFGRLVAAETKKAQTENTRR